ncbi:Aurora kinase A [Beauveria bassiana D1-5]|uniref:EKC/KEOPS complex subunit BUD32 n=1 Tax=Beauveria bassiana D1-5 TaxID=1245745 RepID=A0A0A2V6J1_BEABA|nr:Aurora kinase A [Beauveria bassiana D1-5]
MLRFKASSSNAFQHQDDTKQDPTPPPPYLEYIPVYGEWERKRYPNWPDARFQMPATKEHAGQVYYLRKGDLVGFGTTALVERLHSGNAIVKTPLRNPLDPTEERMNREAVAREAEVYQRLSSGDGNDILTIPKFLGWDAQSCTLTLEHQSNGDLAIYFRDNAAASGVDLETRGKWATQAARALASLHDKEVIHADVAPRNFLLNSSLDLCICDFAGSIFPGGPEKTGAPGSRYQAGPWGRGYVPTKADDLFALGSVLYLIMTGNKPYIDLTDTEVERHFQAAEFPETSCIPYGSVIDDCWHGRLTTAHTVVQALNGEMGHLWLDGTCCVALWLAGGTLLPSQTHVTSHHLRVFRTGQVADCPRGAPRQPSLFPSRPRAGERVALRGAQRSGPTKFALHFGHCGVQAWHPLPYNVLVTGAAGILLARSLFKMIRDREPQGAPASTSPQRDARRRTKRRCSPVSAPLRKRLPRRVAPGSVLDIMRCNSGTALFVRPLCWTDLHAELLKIQFNELPICDTPMPVNEPGSPPPKGHMQPSQSILKLSETLSDILSYKIAHPTAVSDAVCTIMAKLWPESFCQYHVVPDLHLFFGDKVYHEAVRAQIMWTYPSGSCPPSQTRPISSQSTQDATSSPESRFSDSTLPSRHVLTDQPMVCYMGKAQLASIRRNMFRIAPGPNRQFNEPVSSLFKLRSKNLEPQNPDEDSYIAGMLLAMAQKHFYPNPRISSLFRRGISPSKNARPFRDLKLRFMTHDIERAQFIVYTGHMTATFLERFRRPHRMPPAPEFDGDLGFKIDYVRVPIWPILGLRERLGKALGMDLVGEFDPEVMETWEEDDVETPDSSGSKRKRTALGEVVNGSFEDTEEEESSPIHSKKQCIRPRTPLQAAA